MRPQSRQFLRVCWYRSWAVIAATIIFFAVAVSAIRFLLPFATEYKHDIEAEASKLINKDVVIAKIDTDWHWFSPRLQLFGVQVLQADSQKPLVTADVITIGVDLFASLYQRSISVQEISVTGTHLSLQRDESGAWYAQNILIPMNAASTEFELKLPEEIPLLAGRTVRLLDSTIDYQDSILGFDYQLNEVNIACEHSKNRHNVYISALLPEALGDKLELGVELTGSLTDINKLRGTVFMRGMALNLAEMMAASPYKNRVESGLLDFEWWSEWHKDSSKAVTGTVQLQDFLLRIPVKQKDDFVWRVDDFAADLNAAIADNILKVTMDNVLLMKASRSWPQNGMTMMTTIAAEQRLKKGQVAVDFLRTEDFSAFLKLLPDVHNQLQSVGIADVNGDLSNIYIDWDMLGEQDNVNAQAQFTDVGVNGQGDIPSLSGLSGYLQLHNSEIDLELDSQLIQFDYPKVFRNGFEISKLKGRLAIHEVDDVITIKARDFYFDLPALMTQHWFDLELPAGQSPKLNAYALYYEGDLAQSSNYLPAKVMPPNTLAWLDSAIRGGRIISGDFEMRGALSDYPFNEKPGIFRIDFDLENAELQYKQGWPIATDLNAHLKFYGNGLHGAVHSARVLESELSNAEVNLADFKAPILDINAEAYGAFADTLKFIRRSKLRQAMEPVISQVRSTQGSQNTRMWLHIPLKKKLSHLQEYDFVTYIHKGNVIFDDWGLTVSDIDHFLQYSDKYTSATPFMAKINGSPSQLTISSKESRQKNGDLLDIITEIDIKGQHSVQNLLKKHKLPVLQYFEGESEFAANVQLPLKKGLRKPSTILTVNSDTVGTAITLPKPLQKGANKSQQFNLKAKFDKSSLADFSLTLDSWMQARVGIDTSNKGFEIERADVRLAGGKPIMPTQTGIQLSGQLPYLNIDAWQNLGEGEGENELVQKTQFATLKVDELVYLQRTLKQADVELRQQLHNWEIQLDSNDITGQVLVPKAGFHKRGLAINLQHLDFDTLNATVNGEGEELLPSDVPPFQLVAQSMTFNEWQLQGFKMLVEPMKDGVKIHSIKIEDPDVGLLGQGEWLMTSPTQHYTRLALRFESANVGSGITKFGYAQLIDKGVGSAEFDLNWAASPANFDLALLQGEARMAIKDGQILDIDPGGGRLFGLLSLQTIPRRLALDFNDIFAKGLRFDKMNGRFTFANGNAYTSDYYIDGPVGRIDIQGRTGLVAQDYDQIILFRPDLSSSLPLVGTLLGGGGAGVALIVVDRIARLFGKQTDDLARIRYSMTGSWDEPEIKSLRKVKRDTADNSQTK